MRSQKLFNRRIDAARFPAHTVAPVNQLYYGDNRGGILHRFDASHCDEEIILVEADGFGGAVLRVVEGNYPMDFYTREERNFATEAEALHAAESFCEFAG